LEAVVALFGGQLDAYSVHVHVNALRSFQGSVGALHPLGLVADILDLAAEREVYPDSYL
jgi:hypothetical protein